MPRPKNEESFRLFKRKLDGRELFYCRILDEEGEIIATRSTGTDNERKAVKKTLEILKSIPKAPLKKDPLFIDFLIDFWQSESEYVQLRELDGSQLSNTYIDKTQFYIKSLVKSYEPFKKLRLSQITHRLLDKWKLAIGKSNASRKGINHALNGIRVALRWKHIDFEQGISQVALAEKVGCSTTLIGSIEIGKRFPSADNINRIAKALEVKVSDLFSEQEPESMKVMASKKELKAKLERLIDKAIDEHFK